MKVICKPLTTLALCAVVLFAATAFGAELRVGTATADITPTKSVPLWGQFELRLSQGVKSPLSANVCAVEAVENGESADAAIFVSLDVLQIPNDFAAQIRAKAAAKDSSLNPEKIIVFATHTHTAPTLYVASELPKIDGVEDYAETIDRMTTLVADAIVAAWKARVPAEFSWGLEQVSIGWSRRACYFDGRATMYGNPNDPNFSHYENASDPDLGSIFFWSKDDGRLLSVVVDVACTAQVLESLNVVCSDYWFPTRAKLRERFGDDVVFVAAISPAGDDAPHPQYRKGALARMRELRGLDEMGEIARKIDRAVADSYECAVKDKRSDVVFACRTKTLDLTRRRVTDAEYAEAKAEVEKIEAAVRDNPGKTLAEIAFMGADWHGDVVKRYEREKAGEITTYASPIWAVRLGDLVVATNQFELYADYGARIKTRSPAVGTFLIQLAGEGTYLPTEKGVKGGGYSAVVQSCPVGPQGGQELVEGTLQLIGEIWNE